MKEPIKVPLHLSGHFAKILQMYERLTVPKNRRSLHNKCENLHRLHGTQNDQEGRPQDSKTVFPNKKP